MSCKSCFCRWIESAASAVVAGIGGAGGRCLFHLLMVGVMNGAGGLVVAGGCCVGCCWWWWCSSLLQVSVGELTSLSLLLSLLLLGDGGSGVGG